MAIPGGGNMWKSDSFSSSVLVNDTNARQVLSIDGYIFEALQINRYSCSISFID